MSPSSCWQRRADASVPAAGSAGRISRRALRRPARPLDPAVASLAADLMGLLGEDPVPLMRAWQLALEGHSDRTPSECLALAEGLVRG